MVQIADPAPFVVIVLVDDLLTSPDRTAMSVGIRVLVYSGISIDAMAWVDTPSYPLHEFR